MLGGKDVEKILDNYAEKISAADIIRANQQAEAAEVERTRQEAEHYKAQLEELRENARQTKEVLDGTREAIDGTRQTIDDAMKAIDENGKALTGLSEKMDSSGTRIHDVGVQVYRNVQAVVEKSQAANADEFKALKEQLTEAFDGMPAITQDDIRELSEGNEQAIRELKDKNAEAFKEIDRKFEQLQVGIETKDKALLPIVIITLLVSGADLVINILRILGVL